MATADDEQLNIADLDNVDDDGTTLNEKTDRSGSDLDVSGSEDDAGEVIGEEDEENNSYSLPDPEDE